MSLLLAVGDPFESATDHEVPIDPSWSVESTVAYWFPGFAMASGEAVSSCKLFGIASTLMSSEISLGSLCWAGLAKALGRASARRRMREAEVMENSTWEREELRKSGLQLKEVGGDGGGGVAR